MLLANVTKHMSRDYRLLAELASQSGQCVGIGIIIKISAMGFQPLK